ncbi:MAG: ATP-dependent 6-phosphofructokinase [Micromonosporaceae bacterium]|nr:ATP-dependent 6-phosphofructokinase [Micromonosporaceae bacterium]
MTITSSDLEVRTLGVCRIDSPLAVRLGARQTSQHYVDESDRVLFDDTLAMVTERGVAVDQLPGFEPAGPRRKIYFDPSKIRVGIVTCGGLCPGLNDVIRGIVLQLNLHYGVRRIIGFRNGYRGFIAKYGDPVMELTPDLVGDIDEQGGTILGTSRGGQDSEKIVDCLERMDVDVLFVIGGDGSMRGAMQIAQIAQKRDDNIAVVGIPKTIDNDIQYIDHSFGFQTAFGQAALSVHAAHVEATSAPNGVGLVKVMGRHSGFIACSAALAKGDADFVLIPEVPFELEGEHGFLACLRRKVAEHGHAVVVLAEGAGQEHLAGEAVSVDASGNVRLRDIGSLLRKRILDDFAAADLELNLRYFDPSYLIRSVPADPYDSMYCSRLAHAAVHAAMAGRTETVVGRWHGRYVHLPMQLITRGRSQVDPDGDLWLSVLEGTGQPLRFS